MKFLLERCDEKLEVDSVDSEARTLIHVGAREGHARVIELCVSMVEKPNRVDYKRRTLLHYAAWKGHMKTVECLLECSDVKCVKDREGRTTFCVAAEGEESHTRRHLMDLLGLGDVLMRAARLTTFRAMKVLLEHGAEVDTVDNACYTPLHCAAKAGDLQRALFLITHGASISHLKSFPYLAAHPLHLFDSFQNQISQLGAVAQKYQAITQNATLNLSVLELQIFSTRRSPTVYGDLRKHKPLLTTNITIMFVGTEITYGESMVPSDGWKQYLDHKWDREVVLEETTKFPELTMQVNLEYLGRVVFNYEGLLYPNSVVGIDSHTTMIDWLGVAGWGVGGIEVEATMLGQLLEAERDSGVKKCLVKVRDGFFQTRVKGVDIVLDNDIWTNVAKVLVLENSQLVPNDFAQFNKIMVYQSFLRNPRQHNARLFLAGGLKMEERLLHYLIHNRKPIKWDSNQFGAGKRGALEINWKTKSPAFANPNCKLRIVKCGNQPRKANCTKNVAGKNGTAVSKMNFSDANEQLTLQRSLYHQMEYVQTLRQPKQGP
ncbi:hypothetical protein LR48_Vigan04g126200 [Vigna angularis]|uniref:Sucrose phosphatase-like domain-containing protein n=1 Tax=Phaseolus angularis TaxID=3914 RepID=A0A0L9UEV0_PHAAN|nr:hypothetical protein LR48_Vigan04g126200 [Vigna angularis]